MNWIVVKKFPIEQDLDDIAGYLHECKIAHRIYEEGGAQVIAVADPRMVQPIAQLLNELERGTLVIQKNETEVVSNTAVAADQPPSFFQQIRFTPITALLIFLSIMGALLVEFDTERLWVHYLNFHEPSYTNSISLFDGFSSGQLWRIITPTFLHFGLMHIFFNSLAIWDFGRRLELLIGKTSYFFFFIITASLSNIAQFVWQPFVPFGGISGFAYALVGFVMVSHRLAPHKLTALKPAELGFILFFLVLCMTGALDSLIGGGVANAAHLGGLLAGAAYAALTVKRTTPQS